MIFKQYQIFSDGSFQCVGQTSLVRGEFNFMASADSFLSEIGVEYFPTIQIEQHDNLPDEKFRNCLRQMFFVRQLKFFVMFGWKITIVDRDVDGCDIETFGLSSPQDLRHAQDMGISHEFQINDYLSAQTTLRLVNHYLCNLGAKSFWIERWNSVYLVIHVTRKKVERQDVISVKG